MRTLYSIAWWLALPLVLMRLWWRGRKEPGYRQHVVERLGFYPGTSFQPSSKTIWLHAVSVGETRAAEPIITALLAEYPDHLILLTHMTPTGRATGKALFGSQAPRVVQAYFPYDTEWMVDRFLRYFAPRLCVLMETEVWPNMIAQCAMHDVPVVLANARLSARSYKKAQRLPGIFLEAARGIACAAAQTEEDAARLRMLGVRQVDVTGSVKFDVTPLPAILEMGVRLRASIGLRKVLLCASTREGEEALILDAMGTRDMAGALLVIVPRHPQRFDEVEALVLAQGLSVRRRSAMHDAALLAEVDILLGDSMGEMFAYYAACDVAFIGGSLLPLGGQNLIEACAVGKPVLIGPHTFNFSAATDNAIAACAAIRVADADAMLAEAARLLQDDGMRDAMGKNARHYAEQHRGATQRTVALIKQLLDEKKQGGLPVESPSFTN
jgi:3-deoxy-D-manno-octulosonic-acid transferase